MNQGIVVDEFENGPSPYWTRLAVGPSEIAREPGRLRFVITDADATQLANAEIGDYRNLARSRLSWRPPLRMAVRARFSHPAEVLSGTSGFGFWNEPFDLVNRGVLAPPNALWFFCASPRSDMITAPGLPGRGFRAEMITGGSMPAWLMAIGNRLLKLPILMPVLYRLAQTQVHAGVVLLDSAPMPDWHDYTLYWSLSEAMFSIDGRQVLKVARPPGVPLGFVAWMDNQFAVARPDGEFRFGLEAVAGQQWLELERVVIEPCR